MEKPSAGLNEPEPPTVAARQQRKLLLHCAALCGDQHLYLPQGKNQTFL